MRIRNILLSLMLLACHSAVVAGEALTVRVTRAGELAERSGAEFRGLETLKVVGPLNEADFATLRDAAYGGSLAEIDLSEADVLDRKIPDGAFQSAGSGSVCSLRGIVLPENIEEFGAGAFLGLRRLAGVNMPGSLRIIGSRAFQYCSRIKDVSFPPSLKVIGDSAFMSSGIAQVSFAEGLEEIRMSAFSECSSLKEVVLPGSLRFLGESVFYESRSLERFVITPGVKFMSPYMLSGNCALREVELPPTVSTIGEGAFNSCVRLESIVLSEGVELLCAGAFKGCSRVRSITLPSTLKTIWDQSLGGMASLQSVSVKATTPPEYVCSSYPAAGPFEMVEGETLISTPKNLTLYVPKGCAEAYRAAHGWNYFANIVETDDFRDMAAPVEVIEHLELNMADSGGLAASLGDKARRVRSLRITGPIDGSDFDTLWDASFFGLLENLDLGGAAVEGKKLPANAFQSRLKQNYSLYAYSNGLRRIVLPVDLEEIGDYAFYRSYKLEEVVMPSDLAKIGEYAFGKCERLGAFGGGNMLPEGLVEISKGAFSQCESLTSVKLDGTVKAINANAFKGCGAVEEIFLPKDGASLDTDVFSGLPGLRRVYSPAANPPTCAVSQFEGFEATPFGVRGTVYSSLWETPKDIPVYVPAGSKERYEAAPGWNYFTNFVELDEFPEAGIGEAEADRGEMLVEALPGRVALTGGTMAGNSAYSVYNVAGRLIASGRADSATVEIPLAPGIYIVATPASRVKVAVP